MKFLIGILFLGVAITFTPFFKNSTVKTQEYNRIIALSPAHTQFLKYLGLLDKVIAVSTYDKEPLIKDKPKITGGVIVPEENLLKLNPDLVLIGDIQGSQELRQFLSNKNIDSIQLKTTSLQEIGNSLQELQLLFSNQVDIQKVQTYYQELSNIINSTPTNRRSYLAILSIDPIYSLSTNDYLSEVYKYSGWDSVVQTKTPYPVLSEEDVFSLSNTDDLLIIPFLTNEINSISNIQNQVKAKNIIVITNNNIELPSPYLLQTIKELRILQSSL